MMINKLNRILKIKEHQRLKNAQFHLHLHHPHPNLYQFNIKKEKNNTLILNKENHQAINLNMTHNQKMNKRKVKLRFIFM